MKIRMTKLSAGPEGVFPVGTVRDLPKQEAQELIDAGAAEVVEVKAEAEAEIETAALEPSENAMRPAAKKRPTQKRGK